MVLLDVMLPGHDGFEVCQAIREFSEMPIIMLTAKGRDMDKILGLEYGADDYITKPFNILEVKSQDQGYHAPELQKEWEKRTPGGSYGGVRRSEAGPGRKTGFIQEKRSS